MVEPSLLAIFAHPDDEAFRCGGTLALLAQQRGARAGAHGDSRAGRLVRGSSALHPHPTPQVREQELRCACAILGIGPPILLDYPDGALADIVEAEATAQVVAVMEQVRPTVLLTWPPDGLSGHPDHCAVSRWTTRAFVQASAWSAHAPAALYHLAMPESLARTLGLTSLHAVADAQNLAGRERRGGMGAQAGGHRLPSDAAQGIADPGRPARAPAPVPGDGAFHPAHAARGNASSKPP